MKKMFLIILGLSTVLLAEFTKTGGIVTDSITKLQWQDDTVSAELTWTRAIEECEALDLGGHNDWRMPNIKELSSLIDDSRRRPAITLVFQNTVNAYYWSSTTHAGSDTLAYSIYFDSGTINTSRKRYRDYYVRCVRAGE